MKKVEKSDVEILEMERTRIQVSVVGVRPFIANRMSEKARHELLFPAGRKNGIERVLSLKHDPMSEFKASPYTLSDSAAPTLIATLATGFKKAMCSAALDMPGARKAQIGRWVSVESELVPMFGIPRLFMSVTRSADMNRTPDIRTRLILPEWATQLAISFVSPLIKENAVVNLLAAAGLMSGVGDWRTEKGSGDYGQFKLVAPDDPDFVRIVNSGGRAAQEAAMDAPSCYDTETEELFSWFEKEYDKRTKRGAV